MFKILLSMIGISITRLAKEFFIYNENYFPLSIPTTYINIIFSCMFLCYIAEYVVKNKRILNLLKLIIIIYNVSSALLYTISLL